MSEGLSRRAVVAKLLERIDDALIRDGPGSPVSDVMATRDRPCEFLSPWGDGLGTSVASVLRSRSRSARSL